MCAFLSEKWAVLTFIGVGAVPRPPAANRLMRIPTLTHRITLRLTDMEASNLERVAESTGQTVSDVARYGLELAMAELDGHDPPGFPPERLRPHPRGFPL